MPKLVDSGSGSEWPVEGDTTAIGRHSSNDVVRAGRAVSRFHAELQQQNGKFYLRDLGSTFGTYLNGRKLDLQSDGLTELTCGDMLRFGVNPAFPEGEYNLTFAQGDALTAPRQRSQGTGNTSTVQNARVTLNETSAAMVVKLRGTFRGPECEDMAKQVAAAAGNRPQDIVFDMQDVTYMNSYAFGTFLKLEERLKDFGVSFTFAGAGGNVLKLINLVGLSTMFGSYPTVTDATDALRMRRASS